MSRDEDTHSDEREAVTASVRVCPMWYVIHDDEAPDLCYYKDMYGRIRVQVRHLASARMSTWN